MATFPLITTKRRQIAFSIFVSFTALFFMIGFGAAAGLLAPWSIVTFGPSDPHPELHRWHTVQGAATFGVLIGGSLIALMRQPQARPVVAQFLIASTVVLATSLAAFDLTSLVLLSVGAQVAVLYPARRLLIINPWPALRRIVPIRLALTLASLGLLVPDAVESLRSQIDGAGGEHATLSHWGLSFALSLLLVLAGLFATSRRPGSHTMALIVGLALLYLGIAAIAIPSHDGSWGVTGGTLAGLGGLAYLATAVRGRLLTLASSRTPGQAAPAEGD